MCLRGGGWWFEFIFVRFLSSCLCGGSVEGVRLLAELVSRVVILLVDGVCGIYDLALFTFPPNRLVLVGVWYWYWWVLVNSGGDGERSILCFISVRCPSCLVFSLIFPTVTMMEA